MAQADPFAKGCSGIVTRERSCERSGECGRFVAWPAHDTPYNLCWSYPDFPHFKPRADATQQPPAPMQPATPQLDLFA